MSEQIVKGSICWLDIALSRAKRGIQVRVKTRPEIEQFFKSLGDGNSESVTNYANEWETVNGTTDLKVYNMSVPVESTSFTLVRVGEGLKNTKENKVNLSFLRIPGISNEEGIKFCVVGPVADDTLRKVSANIVVEARNLIRQYILPVDINLKITSPEL